MKSIAMRALLAASALTFAINVQAGPTGPELPDGVNCDIAELTTSISCVGVYDPGNDNGQASIFGDATFIDAYGTGWLSLSKVEDPTWGVGALGLELTGQGTTDGTWKVDVNAWDMFAQGDILAILKAGNDAAAYEVDLSFTEGSWDVSTSNWSAGDGTNSALSHFSFWSKESDSSVSISEPSILAIMGIGLAGIGLARRRRKV
jgi:hypothetical protein